MPEPVSLLASLLTTTGGAALSGLVGNEAHRLYRLWRENATDPATGLPRSADLHRASRESLRGAVQVLILELARRVGLEATRLTRMVEHGRRTAWLARPLFGKRPTPQQQWLDAFREAVAGGDFDLFHDQLQLSEEQVTEAFRKDGIVPTLSVALADKLLEWSRAHVKAGDEPSAFEPLVRSGWTVPPAGPTPQLSAGLTAKGGEAHPTGEPGAITLVGAWCLFFRERLKREPRVFNDFVAGSFKALQTRLEQQGDRTSAELSGLREAVQALAKKPPVFTQFEAWLTPQLGALHELLAGAKDQLDALVRGNEELKARQGEILVAITTLRAEVRRGNPEAWPALDGLTAHVTRLEQKLDQLIGGLPIQRFELPDLPTTELDLLKPKHRSVELLGRESDLNDLCAWLESAKPISARLLVGGAGAGKTRLAIELLLRVRAALPAWQAGWLGGDDLRRLVGRTHTPDFNWSAPTLLVVDYAQTLAEPLGKLLQALTHQRRDGRPPLRLLLLERQPGDWFDELLRREDSTAPCSVGSLFHPPTPVRLTPLPPGELRRRLLTGVLQQAAKFNGKPVPTVPPEGQDPAFDQALAQERFDQPLSVMMAGLAATELGLTSALKRERTDLAEALAEKELRRIERFAPDPDNAAQKRALRHLAACATLERGFTEEELRSAVKEELKALQLTWPDGPGDLAERLRRALPATRLAVGPVEPDFIGEAVVLLELARPCTAEGEDRWHHWRAVVERASRRDPFSTPATLLHAFQNFGHQPRYGELLLTATDALIRAGLAEKQPTLLLGIESALPHQTVALRERAAEVTRHLYERLKKAMKAGRSELRPEVARLANNLAIRLSDLGRPQEALGPAREAVELYRALARANPDAFKPDLAMALNTLAKVLSELGRPQEALGPAQKAVELYRELAQANPDAFYPALAGALNNLAAFLSELGRREEALGPAQEAVELRRALARANPDAFNPDLATSLGMMGRVREANGELAAARDCYAEAIKTLREPFLGLPAAHARLMLGLVRDYLRLSKELGLEPDVEMLAPVVERLAAPGDSGDDAR